MMFARSGADPALPVGGANMSEPQDAASESIRQFEQRERSGHQAAAVLLEHAVRLEQASRHGFGVVQLDELLIVAFGQALEGGLPSFIHLVLTLLLAAALTGARSVPLAGTTARVVTVSLRGVSGEVAQRKFFLTPCTRLCRHSSE